MAASLYSIIIKVKKFARGVTFTPWFAPGSKIWNVFKCEKNQPLTECPIKPVLKFLSSLEVETHPMNATCLMNTTLFTIFVIFLLSFKVNWSNNLWQSYSLNKKRNLFKKFKVLTTFWNPHRRAEISFLALLHFISVNLI